MLCSTTTLCLALRYVEATCWVVPEVFRKVATAAFLVKSFWVKHRSASPRQNLINFLVTSMHSARFGFLATKPTHFDITMAALKRKTAQTPNRSRLSCRRTANAKKERLASAGFEVQKLSV
jgi:hypothetical protein